MAKSQKKSESAERKRKIIEKGGKNQEMCMNFKKCCLYNINGQACKIKRLRQNIYLFC